MSEREFRATSLGIYREDPKPQEQSIDQEGQDEQSRRKCRFIRLADLVNGEFRPFHYYPYGERNCFENWRNPRIPDVAKNCPIFPVNVGIWDWLAVENDKQIGSDHIKINRLTPKIPIEVIELAGSSLEDLVFQLRKGVEKRLQCHKILFYYDSSEWYEGLLCEWRLNIEERKGKIFLKADCCKLPKCRFTEADFLTFDGADYRDLGWSFHRAFLKRLDIPSQGEFPVKTPDENIRDVFLERTAPSKALEVSRKTRQDIQYFVTQLVNPSFVEDVAARCTCSKEKAQEYLDVFLKRAEDNVLDFDVQILQAAEKDKGVQERVQQTIRADMKAEIEEHKKETAKLQHDIQEKNQILASKKKTLENLEAQLRKRQQEQDEELQKRQEEKQRVLNAQLEKTQAEIASKEKLLEDVSRQIQEKIAEGKRDVAAFLSEFGLLGAISGVSIPKGSTTAAEESGTRAFTEGEACEGTSKENLYKPFVKKLAKALEQTGVAEEYRQPLAGVLYAAWRYRVPVLLAGPCGEAIANAFSVMISSRRPGVLDCGQAFSTLAVQQMAQSGAEVVVLKNPFQGDWLSALTERFLPEPENQHYILTCPFADDLNIEPSGVFSYVLPILTEYLVDHEPAKDPVYPAERRGKTGCEDLNTDKNVDSEGCFDGLNLRPLARKRLECVLAGAAKCLNNNEKEKNNNEKEKLEEILRFWFGLVPFAFIQGRSPAWLKERAEEEFPCVEEQAEQAFGTEWT